MLEGSTARKIIMCYDTAKIDSDRKKEHISPLLSSPLLSSPLYGERTR